MSVVYSSISDVNPLADNLKIRVRVIRLWKCPSFDNANEIASIDMVLMDDKKEKIHATVKKRLISRFGDIVKEGNCYIISKFVVAQSFRSYRVSHHPFKIIFIASTNVAVSDDIATIPQFGFSFVSFGDVMSGVLDSNYLIDIIGRVAGMGALQVTQRLGQEKKILTIELTDQEDVPMRCTLWDKYAQEAYDYISGHNENNILMFVQFGQIKEWKGELSLANSLFATRILFDSSIEEAKPYLDRFLNDSIKKKRKFVEHLSSQSSLSLKDHFLQNTERKTVDDILETRTPTICVTLATIVCIEDEHGWFYLACKKCNKMVKDADMHISEGPDGKVTTFTCSKCKKKFGSDFIVPRFKLEIKVIDDTGNAQFVLFDREVSSILHRSAVELRMKYSKSLDDDSIPDELLTLVGKRCLFKVEISDYNTKKGHAIFTVVKLTDNVDVIKSFLKGSNDNLDNVSSMGDTDGSSKNTPLKIYDVEDHSDELKLSTTKEGKRPVKIEKFDCC